MEVPKPDWITATPAESGFEPDLADRFETCRQAGVLPNLHGVVVARRGRLVFERYLAGPDAAGPGHWAWCGSVPTRCTTCVP